MQETRLFQTCATENSNAVQELYVGLTQKETELVIFFCSSDYDLNVIATEIQRLFGKIPVLGCTTAGEIGPQGYRQHSIAGVSFSSANFTASLSVINNLQQFEASKGHLLVKELLYRLSEKNPGFRDENCFAFLLIDGLSIREERVAHILQQELGIIPLIGGSAGDDMKLEKTQVYARGNFHTDSAAVVLMHTNLPFKAFMSQHFYTTDNRLVVTKANTRQRIVYEINGLPAAEEYARLVGVTADKLNSTIFSNYPVAVRIADMEFIRSIQKANPDGSLDFYCAIETGVLLRMTQSDNMIQATDRLLHEIGHEIGPPQVILGCDCVLRKMEAAAKGMTDSIEQLIKSNRIIGFNTYGEQFRGIHVNQTITGIAIGQQKRGESA